MGPAADLDASAQCRMEARGSMSQLNDKLEHALQIVPEVQQCPIHDKRRPWENRAAREGDNAAGCKAYGHLDDDLGWMQMLGHSGETRHGVRSVKSIIFAARAASIPSNGFKAVPAWIWPPSRSAAKAPML